MELTPKKSLGQHFLASPRALADIMTAAAVISGETVLEIGPGTGILTSALLEKGARVIAVEKDRRAIELLNEKFAEACAAGKLRIISGDILDLDISNYGLTEGSFSVIANIPYYITGAILEKFLEYAPRPSRMVLLVQLEVAERIVAREGKESILSVSVKAFGSPRLAAKVPRGAFVPPPTVDSAILAISGITAARFVHNNLETKRFFEIVRAGFAHKRKLAARNLETVLPPAHISAIWRAMPLPEKIRAEDLTSDQWFEIARHAQRLAADGEKR